MLVSDLYALGDVVSGKFVNAVKINSINTSGKYHFFKLVFFKKCNELISKDKELTTFLKEIFKNFVFRASVRFAQKQSHNLSNKEYLNIVEYVVKMKIPNNEQGEIVFQDFCKELKEKSFPNNWSISYNFIVANNLMPSYECLAYYYPEDDTNTIRCQADDLDVVRLFSKKQPIENTNFVPVEPIVSKFKTHEEKMKYLNDLRASILDSGWKSVNIDRAILSKDLCDIPEFDGIYGIDSQVRMILTAVLAAKESDGKRKAHGVLFGPAGCGKTTILDKLDDLLGKKNVLRLDAPCMTKSGLETLLLEMSEVPSVIIFEEIEKSSENNLRTLLGIMDERSEICKTTASGSVTKPINSLIFATVNDIEKFNKFLDGALSSRFKNKIFFPKPSKEIIELILKRDIAKNGGKEEWIKPCLDFANELNISDPRMILSFLINGDRLLDGSFQKDYRSMEKLKEEAGYGNS
jgi:hypothetical protein